MAILAAYIDNVGFDNLIQDQKCLSADILVFPHHGGRPGSGNAKTFTQQICTFIKPKLIIFSIDRNRFNNPRTEIVEGIISSVPNAHILCTQLSQQCAASLPSSKPTHLNTLPARGLISNSCCGGTITIKIDGSRTTYAEMNLHKEFIFSQVTSPLCRKYLSIVQPDSTPI